MALGYSMYLACVRTAIREPGEMIAAISSALSEARKAGGCLIEDWAFDDELGAVYLLVSGDEASAVRAAQRFAATLRTITGRAEVAQLGPNSPVIKATSSGFTPEEIALVRLARRAVHGETVENPDEVALLIAVYIKGIAGAHDLMLLRNTAFDDYEPSELARMVRALEAKRYVRAVENGYSVAPRGERVLNSVLPLRVAMRDTHSTYRRRVVTPNGHLEEYSEYRILESIVRCGVEAGVALAAIDALEKLLPRRSVVGRREIASAVSSALMLLDRTGETAAAFAFYVNAGRFVLVGDGRTYKRLTMPLLREIAKRELEALELRYSRSDVKHIVELSLKALVAAASAVSPRILYEGAEVVYTFTVEEVRSVVRMVLRGYTPLPLRRGADPRPYLTLARMASRMACSELGVLRKRWLALKGAFYATIGLLIAAGQLPSSSLMANIGTLRGIARSEVCRLPESVRRRALKLVSITHRVLSIPPVPPPKDYHKLGGWVREQNNIVEKIVREYGC